MKYYHGNNKPYIYALFPQQCEEEAESYLTVLSAEGVLFCHGFPFCKDEKKRIEGAHAVLLFISAEFYEDEQFRESVDYAVASGKKILPVYLDKVGTDAWGRMQLNSSQAIYKVDFIKHTDKKSPGDTPEEISEEISKEISQADFCAKILQSEIFQNMAVTPQQKKFKKAAVVTVFISILATAAFICLMAGTPRIIKAVEEKMIETPVTGLEGMTQTDLDEVTELYIVADKVYVDCDQEVFKSDHGVLPEQWDEQGKISDISDLAKCHNLEKLTLIGCNVKDITPITGLTKLKVLNLNDNPIDSIKGVEKLKELEELSIKDTNVSDLTSICELENLKVLNLENTMVSELPDNGLMEHIISLDTTGTNITSIPYLGTGNMDHFNIDHLDEKAGYLDFLKDKEYFDLFSAAGMDLDDLIEAMKGKKVGDFGVSYSQITSVRQMEPFKDVVTHGMNFNDEPYLTTLDGIEEFEGIKYVSVFGSDNVTDLSAVLNLESLEGVNLDSKLEPIAEEQLRGKVEDIKYDWGR